jgi:DNA repair protein RadA/Sms
LAVLGLIEVPNPSALFLAEREAGVSGAAVFAGMEGSRPLLVEVQALVGPSPLGTPRRTVVGWEGARLAMLLAVLETRCALSLGGRDVYLNVAGGLRIGEPAADLAVAAALVSSLFDRPTPPAAVFFGEVGLAGEVRAVGQTETRLKEAAKLGFEQVVLPAAAPQGTRRSAQDYGMRLQEIRRLGELRELLGGDLSAASRSTQPLVPRAGLG